MRKIGLALLSLIIWCVVAQLTVIAFLLIAIVHPFDRHQRLAHQFASLWGKTIVRINPMWNCEILDRHHIEKNVGYVIVANHSSLADIVCVYCLGNHFKWIAKSSLFKIPFLGWSMSLLKYIPLTRGAHGSIRDSMELAQENLEKNISILFFPEGTRSKTGVLAPFKSGAFRLAIQTRKPILPIVISGTKGALKKGSATISSKAKGKLKVLPQIDVTPYAAGQHEALKSAVWKIMGEQLERAKS
jgi:1-acyl-sn-glycerol-3-phosphate acyltransferase